MFSKSKNLSFKEAIVEEILLAHNPFNVGLEVNGEIPDFTLLGIKSELKALGEIVSLNSKDIKKILPFLVKRILQKFLKIFLSR